MVTISHAVALRKERHVKGRRMVTNETPHETSLGRSTDDGSEGFLGRNLPTSTYFTLPTPRYGLFE